MSSLWTPDGEHDVPRQGAPPQPPPEHPGQPGEVGEEELQQVAREIAATPVEDVVANHCYGLFELAALHLSQQPPNLPAARLSIDSMGYLVDGLGERLGHHAGGLVEGLTQLRLAFVKIADATAGPQVDGAGDGPPAS